MSDNGRDGNSRRKERYIDLSFVGVAILEMCIIEGEMDEVEIDGKKLTRLFLASANLEWDFRPHLSLV